MNGRGPIRWRRGLALALLVLTTIPLEAQFNRFDRNLIDKLYRGDYAHISDDNFGRMDLEAVVMAFRTDDKVTQKCDLFGGTGASAAQLVTILGYIKFLNTDRDTGTFPSAQFLALGIFGGGDVPGLWALDPNMLAMAAEIDRGCKTPRTDTIRTHLVQLLEDRIEWYSKDQSARIPLMQQHAVRITQNDYRSEVEKDVALPAQQEAMRQIAALESRAAQLMQCEYGPTHPDSTGSQTLTLWYGSAPMTMNDFQKVSRKHPLGNYGDDGITTCPKTLLEGKRAVTISRQKGIDKLDQAALAPAPMPLDRVLGGLNPLYQATKSRWIAFQKSHEPGDQQQAMWGKAQLRKNYDDACEKTRRAGVSPGSNVMCQIADQLKYEFQGIPDTVLKGNVYATAAGTIVNPAEPIAAPLNPANSPGLRVGLGLSVITLEAIDLYSEDETRRYKAQLDQPAVWQGQLVLPAGTEVLLSIARSKQPQMPNVMTVIIYAVSTVFNGQPTPITTGGYPATIPAVQRAPRQLVARTRLNFAIQAPKN